MFEHVKLWGNEIISGYNLLLFLHWIFFFILKPKRSSGRKVQVLPDCEVYIDA